MVSVAVGPSVVTVALSCAPAHESDSNRHGAGRFVRSTSSLTVKVPAANPENSFVCPTVNWNGALSGAENPVDVNENGCVESVTDDAFSMSSVHPIHVFVAVRGTTCPCA